MLLLCLVISGLQAQDLQLVWADEFEETAIDRSIWTFGSGPTNDNVHYYTDRPENAAIVDGKLQITALKESRQGFEYTSALLHTQHSLNWRYGRIEARIKLPASPGFVPAFWMLPAGERFGWWPLSGEIDIMEHPTNEVSKIYGTIHTEAYNLFTGTSPPQGGVADIADVQSAFHVYAAEWGPGQIDFYVDDQHYFTYANDNGGSATWPFDEPFYIILNLAVGGGWVGNPSEATQFPAVMEIDYVRLYQQAGDLIINGPDDVLYNSKGVTYRIPEIEGASYRWEVPGGAQIISGQGTGLITVDWGIFGGEVAVEITAAGESFTSMLPVRVSANAIRNAGFETGVKYWSKREGFPVLADFRLAAGAAPQGEHALQVTVNEPAANAWDIQLSQRGFQIEQGKTYQVSLRVKSPDSAGSFSAAVIHAEDYSLIRSGTFSPGGSWTEHAFTFTAPASVPGAFNLDLGGHTGTFLFDGVAVTTPENTRLNQLLNPDFFDGSGEWALTTLSPAVATGAVASGGGYAVSVANGGINAWDIHLGQEGIVVETGKAYTVSFDAFASASREIYPLVGRNGDPWTIYSGDRTVSLSTNRETHTFSFIMEQPTDSAARLGFDIGGDPNDVFIDNVSINEGEEAIGLPRREIARNGPFTILQILPNPVRSETTVHYILQEPSHIRLQVLDIRGRIAGTLVNAFQVAGEYDIRWKAGGLPGGIYLLQLHSGNQVETRKLIVAE